MKSLANSRHKRLPVTRVTARISICVGRKPSLPEESVIAWEPADDIHTIIGNHCIILKPDSADSRFTYYSGAVARAVKGSKGFAPSPLTPMNRK